MRHLTALLHSKSHRCVQEAVTGLSYIVQDNERNKYSVIANRGYVTADSVLIISVFNSLKNTML